MATYLKIIFVAFVILCIGIKLVPYVYLKILSLFYGIFSPQYVLAYNRIHKRNPFSDAVKDDVISHFLSLKESYHTKAHIGTTQEIIFDHIPFGISRKELSARRGDPKFYTVQKFNNYVFIVKRYPIGGKDSHYSKSFFFINDRFVYGELVYTCLDKEQSDSITKSLLTRYDITHLKNDEYIFNIKDKNNNLLVYDFSGHKIILRYGCLSNPLLKEITQCAVSPFQHHEKKDIGVVLEEM